VVHGDALVFCDLFNDLEGNPKSVVQAKRDSPERQLLNTFGIPLEIVEEIAKDEGVAWTTQASKRPWRKQRAASPFFGRFEAADVSAFEKLALPPRHSEFRGYPELDFCSLSGATVLGIVTDGALCKNFGQAKPATS